MIMKLFRIRSILPTFYYTFALFLFSGVHAADWSIHPVLQDYFEVEVQSIGARSQELINLESGELWKQQQPELRRQLSEMLGLYPMPERTPLAPVVTKTIRKELYTVENLHFQSMPGLYVTANLYIPNHVQEPLPAILYVCGHAHAKEGGISFGNKTAYQHHGIWFAKHGFVCLTIDTIQLGEIEGLHHGTYREGRWWWNSRGYTPAGVEAWNGMRALDYLQTRPEVDPNRLGITGRSGGGVYSWWVAALDERIKAAVPVAGITDLHNYVIDGAVEGHCDCMFMVNTHRWDYPIIASLVAPRALLIANSDKDSIFPLDGVVRTHRQVQQVYSKLGVEDRVGLLITEGPHKDTQDLQVPSFRWFQKWLKDSDALIETAAQKEFKPSELRVFKSLPDTEKVTSVDTFFVKKSGNMHVPKTLEEWDLEILKLRDALTRHTFGGGRYTQDTRLAPGLYPFWKYAVDKGDYLTLEISERSDWLESNSEHKNNQIRRRFMLVGQTLDATRVMELKQTLQTLLANRVDSKGPIKVKANGDMAVNAIYAGLLLEGNTDQLQVLKFHLSDLPGSHMQGPDYLNVMKMTRLEESLAALSRRFEVTVENSPESLKSFSSALRDKLGQEASRLIWIASDQ
jgi:dienelactone hydrolase